MKVNNIIVIYWFHRRRRRNRNRRFWIHPIVRQRYNFGTHRTLMDQLRMDGTKFFNYFRKSRSTFYDLLNRVEGDLRNKETNMRKSLSPEERLAICIRYMASGISFRDLHYSYRVGISTISYIIEGVTQAIWNNLQHDFMELLSTESERKQIAYGFETKANFPHCLGAVDGKHIRLKKPSESGSMHFNYKEFFSIVVVDSDFRFLYVNIGSYGKDCDSSIFKQSTFWNRMTEDSLSIPKPSSFNTESKLLVPYVLIGDEGFGLHQNLMTPFGGTHLDLKKRICNYGLTRARRYVECAFGILANKWRIFHLPLDVRVDTAINIVKACSVLHNFVREKEGMNTEKTSAFKSECHFNNILRAPTRRGGNSANDIRRLFADFSVSEDRSVPWQNEAVGS